MPKYKLKSSKAIIKRFKITTNGKILRRQACRNHLLQKKTAKHKRQLRTVTNVNSVDYLFIKTKIN